MFFMVPTPGENNLSFYRDPGYLNTLGQQRRAPFASLQWGVACADLNRFLPRKPPILNHVAVGLAGGAVCDP